MLKNNIVIQYHDFHPSENTKAFIDSTIQDIYGELPGGSTVRATFSAKDKVVKGMLQVNSFGGPLFVVSTSNDLHEMTMKLVEKMRRRLEKFKSKQHEKRSIKHLPLKPELDADYDTGVA